MTTPVRPTCDHPSIGRDPTLPDDSPIRWHCIVCGIAFAPYSSKTLLGDDSDYDDFGAPFDTLKDVRQMRALRAFLNGNSITQSCKAAGVSIGTWYNWKNNDTEFRRMYERALHSLAEELEPDAMARAKESDTLAMFFLKAWNPARYRDRQVIEVVSPDVQSRLAQQADAIMEVCKEALPAESSAIVASKLAHRLREIWSTEDDRKRIAAGA